MFIRDDSSPRARQDSVQVEDAEITATVTSACGGAGQSPRRISSEISPALWLGPRGVCRWIMDSSGAVRFRRGCFKARQRASFRRPG